MIEREEWQRRVLDEKRELDRRIRSLELFIASGDYDEKTTLREQALLSAQLFAMINYSAILGERIGVWR